MPFEITEHGGSGAARPPASVRMILLVAGGMLAGYGLHRRTPLGLVLSACSIPLLYAGLSGRRIDEDVRQAVDPRGPAGPLDVRRSLVIQRPREEVYAFWRQLDRLPQVMKHTASVDAVDEKRHRWSVDLPGLDRHLEWITEITEDEPGRRLAWKSLPGGDLLVDGEIRFEDAPADRGTQVNVRFSYRPPGGPAGRLLTRSLSKLLERLVHEDVRRIKNVLEAGEIPTTAGQPAGAS